MADYIFNRIEKKYVLSKLEYNSLINKINNHLEMNEYGYSTINNIYFDTDNYDLARISIEKPTYKEKVRVRSYGTPNLDTSVFLEIKKKYNGIVNKRRIELKLKQLYKYLKDRQTSVLLNNKKINKQIVEEIEYCFDRYKLKPVVVVSYDRYAYYDKENKNFRITFDTNLRSREYDLQLEKGDYGELYSEEEMYIMEVKAVGTMPIWFVDTLSELKIYPKSFSKYGNIYIKTLNKQLYNEQVV